MEEITLLVVGLALLAIGFLVFMKNNGGFVGWLLTMVGAGIVMFLCAGIHEAAARKMPPLEVQQNNKTYVLYTKYFCCQVYTEINGSSYCEKETYMPCAEVPVHDVMTTMQYLPGESKGPWPIARKDVIWEPLFLDDDSCGVEGEDNTILIPTEGNDFGLIFCERGQITRSPQVNFEIE